MPTPPAGPHTLAARLGHELDAAEIAAYDPERFAALFAQPPAIHRFPGSMAGRVQKLAHALVDNYDGDAAAVWRDAATGAELLKRLEALPGYGKQKAQIFLALIAKQLGVRPDGWRAAAGAYGAEGSRRSVADINDPISFAEVREFKRASKAAGRTPPS